MKINGTKVTVKETENITQALRRFKKAVKNNGVLDRVRELEYYEKPKTTRKKAKAAAIARWRKKERLDRLPSKPGAPKR